MKKVLYIFQHIIIISVATIICNQQVTADQIITAQKNSSEETKKQPVLAKGEVLIEISYLETKGDTKKAISVSEKFTEKKSRIIKIEKEYGVLTVKGSIIEKTDKTIVFEGNCEFLSKDRRTSRYINLDTNLTNGEEKIVGELGSSVQETVMETKVNPSTGKEEIVTKVNKVTGKEEPVCKIQKCHASLEVKLKASWNRE